jgi:hypothetical protein
MTTYEKIRAALKKSKARWELDIKARGEVPHYSLGHIKDQEKTKSKESDIDTVLANVKKLRSNQTDGSQNENNTRDSVV